MVVKVASTAGTLCNYDSVVPHPEPSQLSKLLCEDILMFSHFFDDPLMEDCGIKQGLDVAGRMGTVTRSCVGSGMYLQQRIPSLISSCAQSC